MSSPRRTAWAAGVLVALALALPAVIVPATAADDPAISWMIEGPDGTKGLTQPSGARSGMPVTVHLADWPAHTQVQAVICGQLGIGGSNTCYQPGAALGRIDAAGDAVLQMETHAPPKPCPCVIRVRSFSGAALALDLPFDVVGHKRGKLPVDRPTAAADMAVTDLRVEDTVGFHSLFGLGGPATVVATVTNRGDADGPAPALEYGVGDDGELTESVTPDLVVPARQSREVEIEVSPGVGSMGTHQAQVGAADGPDEATVVTWRTWPWGWLVVVALLAAAAAFARWVRRRSDAASRTEGGAHLAPPYPLPDVVYLDDIGAVVVNAAVLTRSRLIRQVSGRVSAEDLLRLASAAGAAQEPGPDDPHGHAGTLQLSVFSWNGDAQANHYDI